MIRINRWRPDTCDCIIEYSWDDSVPANLRVHTLVSIVKGQEHNGLIDSDAYSYINTENNSKNKAIGIIMSNFSSQTFSMPDGSLAFIPGKEPIWSFSSNVVTGNLGTGRALTLVVAGMSGQEISQFQTLCDSQVGSGVISATNVVQIKP